jgi:hypothetical protein
MLFSFSKMIRIYQGNVIIDKLWTHKLVQETQLMVIHYYSCVGMKTVENNV